jgi:ubiquinone/menaquinone biosynthesis C-methylase UbiE
MSARDAVLDFRRRPGASGADLPSIVEFYTATDADYGAWSRDFNMHFGYCELGMNPLDREAMLARMNAKVIGRLGLADAGPARVADLGCGTGAVARALVKRHPHAHVSGVTIVPAQILRGQALNACAGMGESIELVLRDFTDTGLPGDSHEAAYAVESSCHAAGKDKRRLVAEACRVLKPGGRLVIADCFTRNVKPLGSFINAVYRRWCKSWAVPELPDLAAMREALVSTGFIDIEFTDISWNVAPSIAHVPWVAGRFLVSELIKGRGRISPWRRNHVVASVLSIVLGLHRAAFGYYIVSARKP